MLNAEDALASGGPSQQDLQTIKLLVIRLAGRAAPRVRDGSPRRLDPFGHLIE
jgi:hypothetical protein